MIIKFAKNYIVTCNPLQYHISCAHIIIICITTFIDVYCVDLLGWGYTQLDDVNTFSAQAKVEALKGFWETVGNNQEVVVGGASLGGAAVIEFASENLSNEDGGEGFVWNWTNVIPTSTTGTCRHQSVKV